MTPKRLALALLVLVANCAFFIWIGTHMPLWWRVTVQPVGAGLTAMYTTWFILGRLHGSFREFLLAVPEAMRYLRRYRGCRHASATLLVMNTSDGRHIVAFHCQDCGYHDSWTAEMEE